MSFALLRWDRLDPHPSVRLDFCYRPSFIEARCGKGLALCS